MAVKMVVCFTLIVSICGLGKVFNGPYNLAVKMVDCFMLIVTK